MLFRSASAGKTSIAAGTIQIINSALTSTVGVEGTDDEFLNELLNPAQGILANCTLNMTYGTLGSFQMTNCTWAGNVRYKLQTKTANDCTCGTDDRIDVTLMGKNGGRVYKANISGVSGNQFKLGATDTFYLSGKDLDAIDTVSFQSGGSDGWYPEWLTLQSITHFPKSVKMGLAKWIDSRQVVTFSADDVVADVLIRTANVSLAGTTSRINLSIGYADGTASPVFQVDDTTSPCLTPFSQGSSVQRYLNLGAGNKSPVGVLLNTDQFGANSHWKVASITMSGICPSGNTLGSLTVEPDLWVVDSNNKFFGTTEENTGEFLIQVATADIYLAGTDGQIWVNLVGTSGQTQFQRIDNQIGRAHV